MAIKFWGFILYLEKLLNLPNLPNFVLTSTLPCSIAESVFIWPRTSCSNFWRDSETQFMWLQHKPYCVRILNHPWSLLLVCLIPENVFKMVVGDVGKITSHWHMDILNSLVSWSIKILHSSNASDIYHLVSCHQIR